MRQVPTENVWEFLHPRCALDRAEDIEEVESMMEAGEVEIAKDELRWLLSGCSDFFRAHRMLGTFALEAGDIQLARGHFGHVYRAGSKALKRAGMPTPLPYEREANRDFFESARGLIKCLRKLEKQKQAREVTDVILRCDPSNPLGLEESA